MLSGGIKILEHPDRTVPHVLKLYKTPCFVHIIFWKQKFNRSRRAEPEENAPNQIKYE